MAECTLMAGCKPPRAPGPVSRLLPPRAGLQLVAVSRRCDAAREQPRAQRHFPGLPVSTCGLRGWTVWARWASASHDGRRAHHVSAHDTLRATGRLGSRATLQPCEAGLVLSKRPCKPRSPAGRQRPKTAPLEGQEQPGVGEALEERARARWPGARLQLRLNELPASLPT